ncbi:hypothetical protein BaRGS_00005995, partial [Batillaria attramentaria]
MRMSKVRARRCARLRLFMRDDDAWTRRARAPSARYSTQVPGTEFRSPVKRVQVRQSFVWVSYGRLFAMRDVHEAIPNVTKSGNQNSNQSNLAEADLNFQLLFFPRPTQCRRAEEHLQVKGVNTCSNPPVTLANRNSTSAFTYSLRNTSYYHSPRAIRRDVRMSLLESYRPSSECWITDHGLLGLLTRHMKGSYSAAPAGVWGQ